MISAHYASGAITEDQTLMARAAEPKQQTSQDAPDPAVAFAGMSCVFGFIFFGANLALPHIASLIPLQSQVDLMRLLTGSL